ncbi:HNH endonuclease [Listeria booriae]|uniref:HNH endonuclease n=1 Tax=Listeria booriae TaxID=1552123 RepID=A0A841XNX4_9LIST|nr:HNH endonuclease signature motif containing protein [Listeria booriae]MBC1316912.1 HNH endonuclease [Listeria booriae]
MGYRQCEYENYEYKQVKDNKSILGATIDSRVRECVHKENHYIKIKEKKSNYYRDFEKIYEYKCSYCGINTAINATALCEVDHFVNEKQQKLEDGRTVNHIENLVFSCRKCNQAKKAFDTMQHIKLVHPDEGQLSTIFKRNQKYEIVISDGHREDIFIKQFYEKMQFSNPFRKIDYLLLNLHYMKDFESEQFGDILKSLYIKLVEYRNRNL